MPTHTALAATVALLVSFALTPVARSIARRLGAVDVPGGRRVHARETPRMGGLSVVVAYFAALAAVWVYTARTGTAAPGEAGPVLGFAVGGLVMGAVGAVDDVRAIGAKKKLAGQILAASIAWWAGARIETFAIPYVGDFEFGPIASYVVTLGWIVAFVNAINLIDGLDGLASGIVLFAAITNTIVAFATGNALAAVLNAALGGAVLGFLYFNFNPATVFLGDTGSLFLGYCLGAAALLTGRQKESTVVALLVPLVALGVPLTDTLFTMVRRFLERRPIFSADRGHIHHRLLDLGLTHRRVVFFLYGSSVLTCAAALITAFGKSWQAGGAIALAVVVVLGGARFAGYFRSQVRLELPNVSSQEADVVRHALPGLLGGAPRDVGALLDAVEELVLRHGSFASAVLVSDAGIVWQWGDDASRGPDDDVEYEYAWRIEEIQHRLRFVVRSAGTDRSPPLAALLQVVADQVERTMSRQASVAPVEEASASLPAVYAGARR